MPDISATERQMPACFGVEPSLRDADTPWVYNDALYTVEVDGVSVSFAVAPSYRDVRIIARRSERRFFEFNALGVVDVVVIDEPSVDAVEIALNEGAWLRLQLRPVFEITQGFTDNAHAGIQRRPS